MRIVGGALAGRGLTSPNDFRVRPTAEHVRAALLDALAADLPGARVLALFAGTGALGLEALSRGAALVVFVDSDRAAADVVRRNLAATGLPGGSVLRTPAESYVVTAGVEAPFDVVLADPPYATPAEQVVELLRRLSGGGWLGPGAVVVVERSAREEPFPWPTPLAGLRDRRYGEALLRYGRQP